MTEVGKELLHKRALLSKRILLLGWDCWEKRTCGTLSHAWEMAWRLHGLAREEG